MNAGAKGLVIGRNVLLDSQPELVACALSRIIHHEEDSDAALRGAEEEVKS